MIKCMYHVDDKINLLEPLILSVPFFIALLLVPCIKIYYFTFSMYYVLCIMVLNIKKY